MKATKICIVSENDLGYIRKEFPKHTLLDIDNPSIDKQGCRIYYTQQGFQNLAKEIQAATENKEQVCKICILSLVDRLKNQLAAGVNILLYDGNDENPQGMLLKLA